MKKELKIKVMEQKGRRRNHYFATYAEAIRYIESHTKNIFKTYVKVCGEWLPEVDF